MVDLFAVAKPFLAVISGFAISTICVLVLWKLLPKTLRIPVYELIAKNNKAAGYYYIFAGLITAGTVVFSVELGGNLAYALGVEEVLSRFLLSVLCSIVGIVVAIMIALVTLRLCDYVTTVKEWDLIKSGNEAAGLFFIGAGLIVFTVLIAAAWFPRM